MTHDGLLRGELIRARRYVLECAKLCQTSKEPHTHEKLQRLVVIYRQLDAMIEELGHTIEPKG